MSFDLSPQERQVLLADARESIASKLERRPPRYDESGEGDASQSVLRKPCGAFVTLHKASAGGGRNLRGCIGRMTAPSQSGAAGFSLQETVRVMACEAAFGDPRFPPLAPGELEQCHIEISVLSPMTDCPDARQVKVGVHGLYLARGWNSGVLLPQVPVEQGWNLDEYLDYICVKAGLPAGAYDDPDATLRTFTAVVFGEE